MEVSAQLNHMQSMMEQLVKMIGHNNAVTEELVQQMDKLEAKVDKLEVKVDSLEAKVDKLEARIDSLEAKMENGLRRKTLLELSTLISAKLPGWISGKGSRDCMLIR